LVGTIAKAPRYIKDFTDSSSGNLVFFQVLGDGNWIIKPFIPSLVECDRENKI